MEHQFSQIEPNIRIQEADELDRKEIYRSRHDVYSVELKQYPPCDSGELITPLDAVNRYLVARISGELAGYISITSPEAGEYSIDSYVPRSDWPFTSDSGVYELRVLTVVGKNRGRLIASALMYAAFRCVEAAGGERIIAIGRSKVSSMYASIGLQDHGITVSRGEVDFQLMSAPVSAIRKHISTRERLLARMEENLQWNVMVPFRKPAACFHGGEFFNAIGPGFESLDMHASIINADVLDAWFSPAPEVIDALTEYLPWLLKTSPPVGCEGLVDAIAKNREVDPRTVLVGAGSSDLIFMAFQHWLRSSSRVLMLDPTYGEYEHVCGNIIRCDIKRFSLKKEDHFRVDADALAEAIIQNDIDLVVLVNPNSPTGQHMDSADLKCLIKAAPAKTVFWIDETYIEYVGAVQSLEHFAVQYPNVVICKSMSKAYALSGVRVAYLCSRPETLEPLRALTPPWAVSLPGQVAGVKALQSTSYYQRQYDITNELRMAMLGELEDIGLTCIPGVANFILAYLPTDGPTAAEVVLDCREDGIYLRDAANMGSTLSPYALRIAVKSRVENTRIIQSISRVIGKEMSAPSGFPVDEKDGKIGTVYVS